MIENRMSIGLSRSKGLMVGPKNEITKTIERNALFRDLPPAVIARLSASTTLLNLKRGTLLYHRGKLCEGLYIVVSGVITLSVGELQKANKVIEIIGTGKHAGLAATVLNIPLNVTCETQVDSTLLLIPRQVLLKSVSENVELSLRLIAALCQEICALTDDIEGFVLHSGRKRIALYLLQLAETNGIRSDSFVLPALKGIIASRLNLTPEYFSRKLGELSTADAINVYGQKITILDHDRLRAFSR
jgi:CRP/FNR family transcriptional regulator, dissimilatory nitrate respiration regulator